MVCGVGHSRHDRSCPRGECVARCAACRRRWRRACSRSGRRGSSSSYRPVDSVHLVGSACGGNAHWFSYPVGAAPEGPARVPECRSVIRLHCPIGPAPLSLRTKGHVGLDLDPIGACSEDRRRGQVYREGRPNLRDRLVERAVNLRAGQIPRAVGVNENIPIGGWSRAVELHPIGINRLHTPSLTSGHDKSSARSALEVGKSVKVADNVALGPLLLSLIVQNYLR